MKHALWLCLAALLQTQPAPDYTIQAIRFGTIPGFPVSGLVVGAPPDEKMDVALVVWLIRGGGRTILFDSGFHRQSWIDRFKVTDFVRPDDAVRLAGAEPSEVSDVVISHAHWDHAGGIDLFPNATVWIQRAEFEYYTGAAWQEGGRHGGIDVEDLVALVRRNAAGKLKLVDGDDREILAGIRVFTGLGTHSHRSTFASPATFRTCSPPTTATSTATSQHDLRSRRSRPRTAPRTSRRSSAWRRWPARRSA